MNTKKLLICILLFLSLFNLFLVYLSFKEVLPRTRLQDRKQRLTPVEVPKDKTQPKTVPQAILEINQRNSQIQNFVCEDMEVKVWQDGHRFRLSGKLYFDKPKNFRLELSSAFGKELDIGSNDKLFWYWSKRDREPGIHWATYEDFQKTRLKAPFSPMFMRSSLGLEELNIEEVIKMAENEKDIMLVYTGKNGSGLPINQSVFINKNTKKIDAFLLTTPDGASIAACEIQEYVNDLPSKLLYTWYDESKVLSIKFISPKINTTINSSMWQLPNYTPKINMADKY